MAVNKVIYGGNTVIDLTGDTVTSDSLVEGVVAHDKSGASITGTNPYEKTATDTEVTSQADLIAQIQTALEGKAAGGGGAAVETCTVTIEGYLLEAIVATVYADGEISVYDNNTFRDDYDQTITVENVICGSAISILTYFTKSYYEYISGDNVEFLSCKNSSMGCIYTFKAPIEANSTGTIGFTYLD